MNWLNKHRLILFTTVCLISAAAGACDDKAISRKFILTLDDAALISGQARRFTEELADVGKIKPQTGLRVLELIDRLDSVNRSALEESKKYLVIQPNGDKVLKLTETGKSDLRRIAVSFEAVANSLINDQAFLDLQPEDRKSWLIISTSLSALVSRSI